MKAKNIFVQVTPPINDESLESAEFFATRKGAEQNIASDSEFDGDIIVEYAPVRAFKRTSPPFVEVKIG